MKKNYMHISFLNVGKMLDFDSSGVCFIRCPFEFLGDRCTEACYIEGSVTGPGIPPESIGGLGLTVFMKCDGGHKWQLQLVTDVYDGKRGASFLRIIPIDEP